MMGKGLDGVIDGEDDNYPELKYNPIYPFLMDWLRYLDKNNNETGILASENQLVDTLTSLPYKTASEILYVGEIWQQGGLIDRVGNILIDKAEEEGKINSLYQAAALAGSMSLASQALAIRARKIAVTTELKKMMCIGYQIN